MKICYKAKQFRADSYARIYQANSIIEQYQKQGLRLTGRQLYYQHVARGLLPNTEQSYKGLLSLISDARLAGLVDWEAIGDRGRVPETPQEWRNIQSLTETALRSYRLPRWKGQENYVELWVEKQALAGVLWPMASSYHVTLVVNKGYSSQSAMWESAQRFLNEGEGRNPVLLYLGDHDPSGEDMVRDIRERMQMFGVEDIQVTKVALTMAQIQQYNPPPNPAKTTDSRYAKYAAKHGEESWEVDALPPGVMQGLIRSAVESLLDLETYEEVKAREEEDKKALRKAVENP